MDYPATLALCSRNTFSGWGHGGDELDSSLLLLPGLSALALYLLSVSDCTELICDNDVSINWNLSLCVLV